MSRIITDLANVSSNKKYLGLGMPPKTMCADESVALAKEMCNPANRLAVVEDSRWTIDLAVPDNVIDTTYGDRMDVFGTKDGNPPPGVRFATNTLATPGILPQDYILLGLSVRILVEPEARTIKGNLVTGLPGSGSANVPVSPNEYTNNDLAIALGLAGGQGMLPAEMLYGLPTWRAAYAFMNAYELSWNKNKQESLFKEPLTACATIQPFAMAEAAGLAFTSNIDKINELNQTLATLVPGSQFMPETHRRVGSYTNPYPSGSNVGLFLPSRAGDTAPTMFGGIGVPQNLLQKDPYIFNTPIFWPGGSSMSILFTVNDPVYQAAFQRWLSVTGGSGGNAGLDLNMPVSPQLGGSAPTTAAANVAIEQTLDFTAPLYVSQQVPLNRALLKLGRMVIEVGLIGKRMPASWGRVVAEAIKVGAIAMPQGPGSLNAFIN